MADIYLTKIERKTIFTRSLIYVLVLFLIADLTVTGPFYFNFIPWLFLFSCFISLREVDKTLTGIIGTFTVFMASLLTKGFNADTLLITANAVVQLILGMLTSKGIYQFILEYRLVKYIRPRAKAILIVILMIIFATSYATLSFMEGDIFTYLKSKKNLDNYIEKTYGVEYTIKSVIHNRNYIGKYAYVVEMEDETVQFLPSLIGTFKDINQEERLNKLNEKILTDSKAKIENVVKDMKYITSSNIKYEYEYTKVGVKPDALILHITANTEENAYNEISVAINELLKLEYEVNEVVVTLNNTSIYIAKDNFALITPEYVEGGFNIEDLDE
ncbi:MAG: hypothetical protein IKL68_05235 [Clostridia bacterium]|nr:hypothetical protein [Clostridia bacterium]